MKLQGALLFIVSLLLINPAEARHHQSVQTVSQDCNILWPCAGLTPSKHGERVVKAMGGFGTARPEYRPIEVKRTVSPRSEVIGGRPAGCPHAFCGCEASLYLFGKIIPSLNLAANWFRFPRAQPAPRMAAVRSHHVMVLVAAIPEHGTWLVHDGNSGGHQTRLHERSIAGYTVVNPNG